MKLIIAGSREFSDYDLMKSKYFELYGSRFVTTIISGGAWGADRLGERLAVELKLKLVVFPAEWGLFGKKAGYIRNLKMAEEGNALLAFWNGRSGGTKITIDIMQRMKKEYEIVYF